MWSRQDLQSLLNLPRVNWGLFALGLLLVLAGLAISPIPGPGGIFLIAPGAALILRSSMWAKRHYVRIKRRRPKAGRWMDWSLRRKSTARREALRQAQEKAVSPQVESGLGN